MAMEYCAYSFLKEDSICCDYEIATDQLASSFSIAKHYVKHIREEDMIELMELIYHANGSVRGNCAILQAEVNKVKALYDRYFVSMHQFVLPDGCIGASYLHRIRADVKAVLRILYALEKEGKKIPKTLLDFMNLLSNTCFMMCLYENQQEHYPEKRFVSRSYEC